MRRRPARPGLPGVATAARQSQKRRIILSFLQVKNFATKPKKMSGWALPVGAGHGDFS
jgi:hypothetical protein